MRHWTRLGCETRSCAAGTVMPAGVRTGSEEPLARTWPMDSDSVPEPSPAAFARDHWCQRGPTLFAEPDKPLSHFCGFGFSLLPLAVVASGPCGNRFVRV